MPARRLLSFALVAVVAAPVSLLGGCLPSYEGSTGTQSDDLANDGVDGGLTTPAGVVPDLANTVVIDAFQSTGTAKLAVSHDTATLRLNETQTFQVTVTGDASSTGTATLSIVDAPPGLTATFDPPTVTLGATAVTSTMTVTATSNMDPATSVAATIQASVNGVNSTTTFGVTVLPVLLVSIAQGVATTSDPTAFGAMTIPVKLIGTGTQVTFVNNDTIQHEIHADGTGGIQHESGPMDANGGSYTQTINATGTINFRCHIHGGMTGQLIVQ